MKKLISLVLILCMACMLVPATAEEDVTGDWYGTMMGVGLTMTFNADGTMSMTAAGNEQKGTWTQEGTTITATPDEGSAGIFELKDGTLFNATMNVTLTRNPEDAAAPIQIAEVKADAAAEEFYGDWACSAIGMEGVVLDVSAYTGQSGDIIPTLNISADAVKFSNDGQFGAMLSLFNLVPVYENGMLTAKPELEAVDMQVTISMLQDGTISVSLGADGAMVLYFAPATVAEEPAA